jgi:hypothetical protein
MSDLLPIDLGSISYVCNNMRESDRLEIFGLRPHDSPMVLAYEIHSVLANNGRGRVAWHDGKPVAVIGFAEYWPGVWQVIMVGTNEFRYVAMDCIRWFRIQAAELMSLHGGRRLQCDSRVSQYGQGFLQTLGAKPEGTMKRYGKDGSDYIRYVWLAGENDQVLGIRRMHADAETVAVEKSVSMIGAM